ncbi:patatin-like phospholipase family protein [Dechloromonas sp. ZS-1]|uniref:patatin-like phospholipase family protein n=1 Tax=Dechloromonas sp. ZS-1 TaxID=3138067 RepID=UPI0031FD2F41
MNDQRRHLLLAGLGAAVLPTVGLAQHEGGSKPTLGVVLGGGSARGFAHIGVIKAIEAAGLRPDVIVGCSAGSLIGALWAAGFTGNQMEDLALKVRDEEIIDLVAGTGARGMVTGRSLQDFVNRQVQNRPIEALPTRFIAVATQFPSGEMSTFSRGDTGFAVRASCAIPGVFIPASDGQREYLDGGLVSPIPVQTARKAGAELIVAVDIATPETNPGATPGLYGLLLRSFEIMGQSLRTHDVAQADLVIRPPIGHIPSTDFNARKVLIAAGQQAGARMAPLIRERLVRNVRRKG